MGGEGRERGVGVESGCGGRGEGCDEEERRVGVVGDLAMYIKRNEGPLDWHTVCLLSNQIIVLEFFYPININYTY